MGDGERWRKKGRGTVFTPVEVPSNFSVVVEPMMPGARFTNILRQSYDYLTIMPKLRSTYDKRLIYKTSCKERTAFLKYDSLAKL